jgi:hypothetical protein
MGSCGSVVLGGGNKDEGKENRLFDRFKPTACVMAMKRPLSGLEDLNSINNYKNVCRL